MPHTGTYQERPGLFLSPDIEGIKRSNCSATLLSRLEMSVDSIAWEHVNFLFSYSQQSLDFMPRSLSLFVESQALDTLGF